MDNSVKDDTEKKAMGLGLDDLHQIAGGMSPEAFKKLSGMQEMVNELLNEAVAAENWQDAKIYAQIRQEIWKKIRNVPGVVDPS